MIISDKNNYIELDNWMNGKRKVLLVCDDSFHYFEKIKEKINSAKYSYVIFSDFHPNPLYENVLNGVRFFRDEECDSIMAIGGGSAMDVAKCIKLYAKCEGNGDDGEWLKEKDIVPGDIPFLVVPTTAGTGSEATRYAVIYYKGEKQSITNTQIIPEVVLMDPDVLKTLPLYQRKVTMCDALCHAIESFWSVNSTKESKKYSKEAIGLILQNMDLYLENEPEGNAGMLLAAHKAGQAINITQTTAGHAMCYKITGIFHIAHGHAAILCNRVLFPWMIENVDKCVDSRGIQYLNETFFEIAEAMGVEKPKQAAEKFKAIFDKLQLEIPVANSSQLDVLKKSVNVTRLKNHPIYLDVDTIEYLYHLILA